MMLSELLGAQVVREPSGWLAGRVFDVRVENRGRTPTVTHVVVGRSGIRERMLGGRHPEAPAVAEGELIPWESVVRMRDGSIVIKEGS
jgi:hypothetical protein